MKTKILVVEDDSSISELICMNLEAAGYEPLPFTDGLLAEQFLIETGANGREKEPSQVPALALVDVMLPEVFGSNVQIILIVVDFPAPFVPRNANNSPCFTAKLILFTATNESNRLYKFLISMIFFILSPAFLPIS